CFFFIALRRPGKAGCFGIGKAPCRDAQVYQITPEVAGFSDLPILDVQHLHGTVTVSQSHFEVQATLAQQSRARTSHLIISLALGH
ncbi:MAG: hypothetical protein WBO29_09885, partial [Albidovulum sp.]